MANDVFGIKMLKPTKAGGETFTMNNSNFNNSSRKYGDSVSLQSGYWVASKSSFRYTISTSTGFNDGNCTQNQQTMVNRGYMQAANDWKNVEFTAEFRVFNSVNNTITLGFRGGRHTGSGGPRGCTGADYKIATYMTSGGRLRIRKESWHVSYHSIRDVNISGFNSTSSPFRLKILVYNSSDNKKVTVEVYLDKDRNNNFVKVAEMTDSGQVNNDAGECKCTNKGQPLVWGSPVILIRGNAGKYGVKDLTIREIDPFGTGGGGGGGGGGSTEVYHLEASNSFMFNGTERRFFGQRIHSPLSKMHGEPISSIQLWLQGNNSPNGSVAIGIIRNNGGFTTFGSTIQASSISTSDWQSFTRTGSAAPLEVGDAVGVSWLGGQGSDEIVLRRGGSGNHAIGEDDGNYSSQAFRTTGGSWTNTSSFSIAGTFLAAVPSSGGGGSSSEGYPVFAVIASGDDGNVPSNTRDGDFDTRWSSHGVGEWIEFDLGSQKPINRMKVAWYKGTERTNNWVIRTSTDGGSWPHQANGVSSGNTNGFESYTFPTVTARYIDIRVDGNSSNDWASITEVEIFGPDSTSGGDGGGGTGGGSGGGGGGGDPPPPVEADFNVCDTYFSLDYSAIGLCNPIEE